MEREFVQLDRGSELIGQSYGSDRLDLVLGVGVSSWLGHVRVVRHLAQHHANLLAEFRKIANILKAA